MLDPADAPLPLEDPATPSAPVAGRPDGYHRSDDADGSPAVADTTPYTYDPDSDAAGDPSRDGADSGSGDPPTIATRRAFSLDTRPDWMNALRREDARNVRYGRQASVVLLELTREASGAALDAIAHDVADVICGEARSTDRAVRLTAGSFRILMPETSEESARAAAGRLERTYESTASGDSGELLRIDVATCSGSRTLIEAVEEAEERLGIVDPRRMSSSA